MKRTELADAAEAYINSVAIGAIGRAPIIALSRSRFLGVGADQYQLSEDEQSFERSTVGTMLVGLIEELVDQINYATMIDILIDCRIDDLDGKDSRAVAALNLLRDSLADVTYDAVCASAGMSLHMMRLTEIGEYAPRTEGDYIAQLQAECDEAEALTPETPTGIDAIEREFEAVAGELDLGVEFVGVPASEYRAGIAYILALEEVVRESNGYLAEIRQEVSGDFTGDDLSEWFVVDAAA